MAKAKKTAAQATTAIEHLPTADLVPYARNSRTHSDEQVAQIAASIREFGFCNPVLIDAEGTIIAGHGRVMAATRMKLEAVPCLRLSHLTDAQKRAYVLADNRIALSSGWDTELLANELSDLHADEFDMALLGFDADELAGLLKLNGDELPSEPSGEIVEDEVPEPPVDPITKPGDLWILGEHRLLCGDSTKAEDVGRLMAGVKADLLFTDPPYGDFVGGMALMKKAERVPGKTVMKRVTTIENDGSVSDFSQSFRVVHEFLKEDSTKLVFFKWNKWEQIKACCSHWGEPSSVCVWDRVHNPTAFHRFVPNHEFCFHWGNLEDKKEPIKVMNVWSCKKEQDNAALHPTVKPQEILAPAIRVCCQLSGVILDLFCGSGSTLIAAEQLNRKCYGMEISPAYCDVIVKRWENLTGKTATLEAA
jgi:DNA modification methylase